MLRLRSMAALGCVCTISLTMRGCAPGGGSGDDNTSPSNAAVESAAARVVMAIIAARNEDRRAESESLTMRALAPTACPFGGSRDTDADGVTTFMNCGMLPGVTLNGRLRFTPGPEGTQGGRIEFFDLEGTNNGAAFRVDGTIEETENADGSLTFDADVRSSTANDGETDEFNFNGNVKIDEDGAMEGNLRIDQGQDDDSPNDCNLNGLNLLEFQSDENAFLNDFNDACGFDQENPDEEEEGDAGNCDCAPGEECIEVPTEDGASAFVCSNCRTNQDCVDAGLGNECALGFTCTTVECFTDDDCPEGFECDGFLGGGDCVEETFFFP